MNQILGLFHLDHDNDILDLDPQMLQSDSLNCYAS